MSSSECEFNTSAFMVTAGIAIGIWLITGGLGYSDCDLYPIAYFPYLYHFFLFVGYIACSIAALVQIQSFKLPDRRNEPLGSRFFVAGFLGLSIMWTYCLVSPGWRNSLHVAAWAMGGAHIGVAVELCAAPFGYLARWVERLRGGKNYSPV